MTEKEKLEKQLWNIANTLRGKMGADDFRDYILGFIFFKYLSEKMHTYANRILKPDGIRYTDIDESTAEGQAYLEAVRVEAIENNGYFLKPSELFSELAKRGNGGGKSKFILDELDKVLTNIAKSTMGAESEEDFDSLFEDIDLKSSKLGKTESAKNELIVKVLTHLEAIDFRLNDTESDVLGDAYEYLIGKFASGAGKKAGEFYTPQQVSTVLARIVTTGRDKLKTVYDPTCGSGSLLLRVEKEVGEVGKFYGQESNPTTYNLCRMNMIMHGVHYRRFDIKNEDTLEQPQHVDLRFDAIVANPPFSAKWSASPLFMSDDRFSPYGKLAPGSKADFAFVQHMLHQLDDNGTMAVVLPHGVLFRGAAEGHIRKYLIEERNVLDAVIGLPANIFFGTSIPTCILVLKKQREQASDVLFIDASQHFEKATNQNVLRAEDIEKIVATYRDRKTEDKYSYVADLDEIRENDHNLNIPRYVDTFEEEEPVDLDAVSQEIKSLDEEMQKTDMEIESYCKQLGIQPPFNRISKDAIMKPARKYLPDLRYPEFVKPWEVHKTKDLFNRIVNSVRVEKDSFYQEIGIRSHGKGLFHKAPVRGESLGNKRVFWIKPGLLILNIVFAWEQAVSKTTEKEIGMIASHRFPMFEGIPHIADLEYFLWFFMTKKGKYLLELASPGGAGRNKTLGQKTFENLKIIHPGIAEQQKIASFLSAVDRKIQQLTRKRELLEQYKKGVMQKIFSREIWFKDEEGKDFSEWEEKRLNDIALFLKGKGISKSDISATGNQECIRYGELYTVYQEVVTEIQSKTNIPFSDLVIGEKNDVIIPASGETHIDIATASCIQESNIAIGGDINIIRSKQNGVFLAYYLNSAKKVEIAKLAQGNSVVHLYSAQLKKLMLLLPSIEEQKKIATFLSTIDKKIELTQTQITQTETFKRGLLQQMFV